MINKNYEENLNAQNTEKLFNKSFIKLLCIFRQDDRISKLNEDKPTHTKNNQKTPRRFLSSFPEEAH